MASDGDNVAAAPAPHVGLIAQIASLKERHDRLLAERRMAAKEIKAKKRKLNRVKKAVQKLTAEDLAEVVLLVPKAKAAPKAQARPGV